MILGSEYDGEKYVSTLHLEKHESYYLAKFREFVKDIQKAKNLNWNEKRFLIMKSDLVGELLVPYLIEKLNLRPVIADFHNGFKVSYVPNSELPSVDIKCEGKDFRYDKGPFQGRHCMRLTPVISFMYRKDDEVIITDPRLDIHEFYLRGDELVGSGASIVTTEFAVVIDSAILLSNRERGQDKSDLILDWWSFEKLQVFPITGINESLNLIDKIYNAFMERREALSDLEKIKCDLLGLGVRWTEENKSKKEALEIGYSVKLAQTLEELMSSSKIEL